MIRSGRTSDPAGSNVKPDRIIRALTELLA